MRWLRGGIQGVAFQPEPEEQEAMDLNAMDPSHRARVARPAQALRVSRLPAPPGQPAAPGSAGQPGTNVPPREPVPPIQ